MDESTPKVDDHVTASVIPPSTNAPSSDLAPIASSEPTIPPTLDTHNLIEKFTAIYQSKAQKLAATRTPSSHHTQGPYPDSEENEDPFPLPAYSYRFYHEEKKGKTEHEIKAELEKKKAAKRLIIPHDHPKKEAVVEELNIFSALGAPASVKELQSHHQQFVQTNVTLKRQVSQALKSVPLPLQSTEKANESFSADIIEATQLPREEGDNLDFMVITSFQRAKRLREEIDETEEDQQTIPRTWNFPQQHHTVPPSTTPSPPKVSKKVIELDEDILRPISSVFSGHPLSESSDEDASDTSSIAPVQFPEDNVYLTDLMKIRQEGRPASGLKYDIEMLLEERPKRKRHLAWEKIRLQTQTFKAPQTIIASNPTGHSSRELRTMSAGSISSSHRAGSRVRSRQSTAMQGSAYLPEEDISVKLELALPYARRKKRETLFKTPILIPLDQRYNTVAVEVDSKENISEHCQLVLNQAIASFDHEDWTSAIKSFSEVIEMSPGLSDAYCNRGICRANLGRPLEALEDLSMSIGLDPNNNRAFMARGSLLQIVNPRWALEDVSKALLLRHSEQGLLLRASIYETLLMVPIAAIDYEMGIDVIKGNPEHSQSYAHLGRIYTKHWTLRDYPKALKYYEQAILYDPTNVLLYTARSDLCLLLHHHTVSKQFEQGSEQKFMNPARNRKQVSYISLAIRDYTKAIHLAPSNFMLYLQRGRLFLKNNHLKHSMEDFTTAVELNSGIAQSFLQRALFLSFKAEFAKVIEEFGPYRLINAVTDPFIYTLVAKACIKLKNYTRALDLLDDALKLTNYKDAQLYMLRAYCWEKQKMLSLAMEEYTKAIMLNKADAKAYCQRGLCKLRNRDITGLQDLAKCTQIDPNYHSAYVAKASYSYQLSLFAQSIDECDRALALRPGDISALLLRGASKAHLKLYSMALNDFTHAIQLDRLCIPGFFNRALAHELLGDYTKAVTDLSLALLLDGKNMLCYRKRAQVYWKTQDYRNALMDYQIVKQQYPDDIDLNSLIGTCHMKLNDPAEAVFAFDDALRLSPNHVDLLLAKGGAYASLGKFQSACAPYIRAVQLSPTNLKGWLHLAHLAQLHKRYNMAWQMYNSVLALDPQCVAAWEGRALNHVDLGNFEAAMEDAQNAMSLNPRNPSMLVNFGTLLQHKGDIGQAMECFKTAAHLDPTMGAAFFNAGNLYFYQQFWKQACASYSQAIALSASDHLALVNRGIARSLLKDTEGALLDFATAIKHNPQALSAYFNRACLYEKLGRHALAEKDYNRVINLMPQNSAAYFRRAALHSLRGRDESALADLAQGIALED